MFHLDRPLLLKRLGKAVTNQDKHPLVQEVARRMDERLDYIRLTPERVLDLGSGTGEDIATLARRYPQSQQIAIDIVDTALKPYRQPKGLLKRWLKAKSGVSGLCADACNLPLATGSLSLVWSNLMLPWLDDPTQAIKETHRVLEVGGLFMFTTLGPDTLKQLREAFDDADGRRVHRFIDMHDIGDALVNAGFSDPVMDMEMLTMTFKSTDSLLQDLRQFGANNASANRHRGLTGKAVWQKARERLAALSTREGLPISIEIIHGHAWKAPAKKSADGRDIIRFETKVKPNAE